MIVHKISTGGVGKQITEFLCLQNFTEIIVHSIIKRKRSKTQKMVSLIRK